MNVCVVGYGHFASIVAVCLAERGHVVIQSDETPHLMRASQISPDLEPGFPDLAKRVRDGGALMTTDVITVGRLETGVFTPKQDIYWIAYDVPLDTMGAPDTREVRRRIIALHARVPIDIPFLVSCQWPVGTTNTLEVACPERSFVYVLENVRAGKAIADFQSQPSMIVGVRGEQFSKAAELLQSVCKHLVVMTLESAEMSKHALNAFMALQIAFVNEIADIAAHVSADPEDVSAALLSDPRVSPRAPLRAGGPFGGGSLQRDLLVLERLSKEHRLRTPILSSILRSNTR